MFGKNKREGGGGGGGGRKMRNSVYAIISIAFIIYLGLQINPITPPPPPPRPPPPPPPPPPPQPQPPLKTMEDVVGVDQENLGLVQYVYSLVHPPSNLTYNLSNPKKKHFSQFGQSDFLNQSILHGMKRGVFLEAGAADGEFLSNTLFLERELEWTGILIEPIPATYNAMKKKNRKAYALNAALSTTTYAKIMTMKPAGNKGVMSGFVDKGKRKEGKKREEGKKRGEIEVLSLPLYTILLSLNVTQIDFLSLDLEGYELQVLETVPWDKIKVRVMCIECNKVNPDHLTRYLESQGYSHIGNFGIDCWYGWADLLAEYFL